MAWRPGALLKHQEIWHEWDEYIPAGMGRRRSNMSTPGVAARCIEALSPEIAGLEIPVRFRLQESQETQENHQLFTSERCIRNL
jgi:hypothetical protein